MLLRTRYLKRKLKNYEKVALYGAGQFAKDFLRLLRENDIAVDFCIVTAFENTNKNLDGIPIYSIKEFKDILKNNKILIIIATTRTHVSAIESILRNFGIENYLLGIDCIYLETDQLSSGTVYQDSELIDRSREWGEANYKSDNKDNSRQKYDIAFVVIQFSPRVTKIVKSLDEKNKKVAILTDEKNYKQARTVVSVLENYEIRFYKCVEELIFYLESWKYEVMHIFSHPWAPYIPYMIIRMKDHFGKIVFENYDVANGMYTIFSENELEIERYCMEHADGVCCRGFEMEYLINNLGFHINKLIVFMDYCMGGEIRFYIENRKNEDILSLCYVGGIFAENENIDSPYYCIPELSRMCADNQCHLHIYPSVWDEKRYGGYIEHEKTNPYFHIHKTISYGELIEEISQYDYGIFAIKKKYIGNASDGYTENKHIYAATNKFFDYLDAGLPIIAATPTKLVEMLEKENVLLKWTIEQYDFEKLRELKRKGTYRENVKKAKSKFSIHVKIDELIEFYESLKTACSI